MKKLAQRLRKTRVLGPLSTEQILYLLESRAVLEVDTGDILIREQDSNNDHLILLEGSIEVQRTWTVPGKNDKSYTRNLNPSDADGGFAFLCALNRLRVRALTPVKYLLINADNVDALLGWSKQFTEEITADPELRRRMNLIKHVSIFYEVPLENIKAAFKSMASKTVAAGEVVVKEGEPGDCYYIIDTGEAEIRRTDPFTGEVRVAAGLTRGDAFGEEALLQNAYRNATITMKTPGSLLVLEKADFDRLLKPHVIEEITAQQAKTMIDKGDAEWIDCRYDLEYEESRLPGAALIPLDRLRQNLDNLNPETTYIVYCRSGRRSKAGAFILRERHIKAFSMTGGIKDWPYELDASPVELSQSS